MIEKACSRGFFLVLESVEFLKTTEGSYPNCTVNHRIYFYSAKILLTTYLHVKEFFKH